MKTRRIPLAKGSEIVLQSCSGQDSFCRTFTIQDLISHEKGGFCLCYSAYHGGSSAGILKEFYPAGFYLNRHPDGSLRTADDHPEEIAKYTGEQDEYFQVYDMLVQARKTNPQLATFIPYFEVYQTPNGLTKYLFSYEPQGMTFARILESFDGSDPLSDLVQAVSCLFSLSQCLSILHGMDLYHCDVKPDNFCFLMRNQSVLHQKVTLFDVNSFMSSQTGRLKYYSPDYMDPFYRMGDPLCLLDLYGTGRCLLEAVLAACQNGQSASKEDQCSEKGSENERKEKKPSRLVEEDIETALYRLRQVTEEEELIAGLRFVLTRTMLHPRFPSMDELGDALSDLLVLLQKKMLERAQNAQAKKEKSDLSRIRRALWNHFYHYPVHERIGPGNHTLRALIVGDGEYCPVYLDLILILGQCAPDLDVRVTGICDYITYQKERPALKSFVSVDQPGISDQCGALSFQYLNPALSPARAAARAESIVDAMEMDFDFVFIQFQDRRKERAVSRKLRNRIPGGRIFCKEQIEREFEDDSALDEIERMAFNVHLLWEKDRRISLQKRKETFQEPYYHDSSVLMALSIQDKLGQIPIPFLPSAPWQAADCFYRELKQMNAAQFETFMSIQAWVEHRRWVMEKVTNGFTPGRVEDSIIENHIDLEKKTHICLVRSEPNQNFRILQNDSLHSIDIPSDLRLDELDAISLALIENQQEAAKLMQEARIISEQTLDPIETFLIRYPRTGECFSRLKACVQQILNYQQPAVFEYRALKLEFLEALGTLPGFMQRVILRQFSSFDQQFFTILRACQKRIFKEDDVRMVEQIPFVLTWSEHCELFVPCRLDNLSAAARAVLRLNPAALFLIIDLQDGWDAKKARTNLEVFAKLLSISQCQTDLHVLVLQDPKTQAEPSVFSANEWIQKELSAKACLDWRCIDPSSLRQILSQRTKQADYVGIEENQTRAYQAFFQACLKETDAENDPSLTLYSFHGPSEELIEQGIKKVLTFCPEPVLDARQLELLHRLQSAES